jgi:hypothetical protein
VNFIQKLNSPKLNCVQFNWFKYSFYEKIDGVEARNPVVPMLCQNKKAPKSRLSPLYRRGDFPRLRSGQASRSPPLRAFRAQKNLPEKEVLFKMYRRGDFHRLRSGQASPLPAITGFEGIKKPLRDQRFFLTVQAGRLPSPTLGTGFSSPRHYGL